MYRTRTNGKLFVKNNQEVMEMEPVNKSLYTYLQEQTHATPQKQLLGGTQGWLDARTVLARVNAMAQAILGMGIGPGDLVAVRTSRCVETALMLLALQAVGAVAVLCDPRQEPEDYLRNCDVSLPVMCILTPERIALSAASKPTVLPDTNPVEPGFLIFTSGSTGKPKAVMLSQYNLVNNLIDSQPLGDYSPDDIALGALPMDHVFGLVLLAGVCVLGYAVYFPERTDIPSILSCIAAEKITRMNGVPSLYLGMARQAAQYDLSSLRVGFIGGAPFTREQFLYAEESLQMTLIPVYGMSECIGIACASWRDPQILRSSGSAPFYAMNTGKILREDSSEAAVGETGEIFVTGPARMVGYWPDAMPPKELLATGDLGYLDEQGRLHLTGRKKDIIIRNGNNLSIRKIEEAILSIPVVEEAAVIGVADEVQGEVPWAMVVAWEQSGFREKMAERLHKNEIPSHWCFVAQIPKTASGKPDKQKIREVLGKWKA